MALDTLLIFSSPKYSCTVVAIYKLNAVTLLRPGICPGIADLRRRKDHGERFSYPLMAQIKPIEVKSSLDLNGLEETTLLSVVF